MVPEVEESHVPPPGPAILSAIPRGALDLPGWQGLGSVIRAGSHCGPVPECPSPNAQRTAKPPLQFRQEVRPAEWGPAKRGAWQGFGLLRLGRGPQSLLPSGASADLAEPRPG
jgi:hypothetical protein